MKYLFYTSLVLILLSGCSLSRNNHCSTDVQTDFDKSSDYKKLIGIWESRVGGLKNRFFSNGMFASSQFAYTLEGQEIVENLSGSWRIESNLLVYIYDDSKDVEWTYSILDLTEDTLVLKREDYIEYWHRVPDFNLVVEKF